MTASVNEDRERLAAKRRKRTILSCTNCHARKQKCDRERPCRNCISRNVDGDCQYMTPFKKSHSESSTSPDAEKPIPRFDIQQFIYESLRLLPNQQSSKFILDHFFSSIGCIHPDFGEDWFWRRHEDFWQTHGLDFNVLMLSERRSFDDILWFATYAGMIATTLQVAPRALRVKIYHPSLSVAQMSAHAYDIAVKAQSSPQARASDDAMARLWALALCIGWQKNAGRAYIAQEHAAEAIHIAVSANMHLNCRPEGPITQAQWIRIDQYEQIWALLCLMDRNLSFLLNRKAAISDIHPTAQPPRNVLVYGGPELPEHILTRVSHLTIGRRMVRILDMIEETLAACKTLSNQRQKDILMDEIDTEFNKYEASLPAAYADSAVGTDFADETTQYIQPILSVSRQISLVYYLEAVMRLHRPTLAHPTSTIPSSRAMRCISASLRLLETQTRFITKVIAEDDEYALAWFTNAFFLYDPAMTLLLALLNFPTHADTPKWCHAVDDADRLLCSMSQLNISANHGRSVLQVFKKQASRRLFLCGKGWQGDAAMVSVLDVDSINDAMTNSTMTPKDHEVPFDYLGITVNWGLGTDPQEMVTEMPSLTSSDSSTDQSAHTSPVDEGLDFDPLDFDFDMPLNPLDLLQADYMNIS